MQAYTSMPSDMESAPKVCHLWRLPQELLDEIFEMAYPRGSCHQGLITRHTWDIVQDIKATRTYFQCQQRSFPYKVNEFLVSKRFFQSAARAWVGALHFGPRTSSYASTWEYEHTIFPEYAQEVTVIGLSDFNVKPLYKFESLRKLHFTVTYIDLVYKSPDYTCSNYLTDEQLLASDVARYFVKLPARTKVFLTAGYNFGLQLDRHRQRIWKSNVARVQHLINQELREKNQLQQRSIRTPGKILNSFSRAVLRVTNRAHIRCLPLYKGSLVCSMCSPTWYSRISIGNFLSSISPSSPPAWQQVPKEVAMVDISRVPQSKEAIREMVENEADKVVNILWAARRRIRWRLA